MAYSKGFNYQNIAIFCERFGCELLTSEADLNSDTKIFKIRSRCGCETFVSFSKLLKYKIGIYCDSHLLNYVSSGKINCVRCNCTFAPVISSYLYCSYECSQSRDRPEEVKNKIKNSVLTFIEKNKQSTQANLSDELVESNESNNLNKKRKRTQPNQTDQANTTEVIQPKRKIYKHEVSYDTIKTTYELGGCELITSRETYNDLRDTVPLKKIQFSIKSSCGHETDDSLYYSFVEQNTGKLCKKCTTQQTSQNLKSNSKINGFNRAMIKQREGIDIMISLLEEDFYIKKTRDGCKSIILLKPKILNESNNSDSDSWLQIKLKTKNAKTFQPIQPIQTITENIETTKSTESTESIETTETTETTELIELTEPTESAEITETIETVRTKTGFRIESIHPNVVVVMLYVDLQKIWVFEPDQLEIKTYYAMDKTNNKYSQFFVEKNILSTKLKELYEKQIYNDTFENANEPISSSVKLEYTYVLKRRNTIKFLDFVENNITSLVYNFKIFDLKVQEKVFSPQRKNIYATSLCKNHGRQNKGPYEQGDNDIYWLNVNDGIYDFYVIPEYEMIRIECVTTSETIGSSYFNLRTHRDWLGDYKFNYNTINEPMEKKRLLDLINMIISKKTI